MDITLAIALPGHILDSFYWVINHKCNCDIGNENNYGSPVGILPAFGFEKAGYGCNQGN